MEKSFAKPQILFSAPCDFMNQEVFEGWPFEIIKKEIWHENEIVIHPSIIGWITNTGWSFQLSEKQLALMPNIKAVVTPSTGSDHINIPSLKSLNIHFKTLLDDRENLEKISASAEHAFLLLLNSLRRLPFATQAFNSRKWRRDMEGELRGRELRGRKVGLVGYGRIGKKIEKYCNAFEASCLYYDPKVSSNMDQLSKKVDTLDELFKSCDSIVVCCTLNEETKGMISGRLLSLLKKNATLVNIARGEIINEFDLRDFILMRRDVQVSLDVLNGESLGEQFNSPLVEIVDQNYLTITPHIGGSSYESQEKAAKISLSLIKDLLFS